MLMHGYRALIVARCVTFASPGGWGRQLSRQFPRQFPLGHLLRALVPQAAPRTSVMSTAARMASATAAVRPGSSRLRVTIKKLATIASPATTGQYE
jgi:hypothetical protein